MNTDCEISQILIPFATPIFATFLAFGWYMLWGIVYRQFRPGFDVLKRHKSESMAVILRTIRGAIGRHPEKSPCSPPLRS